MQVDDYDDGEDSDDHPDGSVFIKDGKLILFVDSNQDELDRSRVSFEALDNFKGSAKYFESGE